MPVNWLTTKHVSQEVPGMDRSRGSIVRANEDTSSHVNKLLSDDRVSYIYSTEDDSLIDVVDSGTTAFSYNQSYIRLDDGNEIEIGVSETIELKSDKVIYKGSTFPKESLHTRKISCTTDRSNVHNSKENISADYYSFYDAQKRKRYVEVTDVIETYKDADVKDMSVMEMTSLPSDRMNEKFIAGYFGNFNVSSPEFFEYINKLFGHAVKFLSHRAPILASRKPFNALSNLSFSSQEDILDFLKKIQSTDRRESMTVCTLLKFVFLLHKYRQNPIFEFWEKCSESDDCVIAYIRKAFNLDSAVNIKKDDRGRFIFTKHFPEYSAVIPIAFRVKSLDSLLQKSLSSASYIDFADFRDIFASTAYIPEEARNSTIGIMRQFDTQLTMSDAYVKNKGFLTSDNTPNNAEYKYRKAKGNVQRGTASSDKFSDATQIGEHPVKFSFDSVDYEGLIGMENRFVYGMPESDVNEKGLTCHPVYDYFAKHFEGEQNRSPFYTASNLSKLFDDFFGYLQKKLKEKYPEFKLYTVLSEIFDDLEKENETESFPKGRSSDKTLEDFYHSKMKFRLFKYFVKKFELTRMSHGNEMVFVSKSNMHQLKVGGRGYKVK